MWVGELPDVVRLVPPGQDGTAGGKERVNSILMQVNQMGTMEKNMTEPEATLVAKPVQENATPHQTPAGRELTTKEKKRMTGSDQAMPE